MHALLPSLSSPSQSVKNRRNCILDISHSFNFIQTVIYILKLPCWLFQNFPLITGSNYKCTFNPSNLKYIIFFLKKKI